MKPSFVRLVLTMLILSPALAQADLLIYKGTAKENYLGQNNLIKVTSKVILIIDRDTANVARLQYATVSGYKSYYTSHTTNLHFVVVSSSGGKLSTAVSHIPSECQQKEDPNSEGVFLSGVNSTVSPDGKAMVAFPKVLTGGGRGLFYSDQSHQPILGDFSLTVAFNQTETVTSNNSSETLDTALARYEALIRSQGYNP